MFHCVNDFILFEIELIIYLYINIYINSLKQITLFAIGLNFLWRLISFWILECQIFILCKSISFIYLFILLLLPVLDRTASLVSLKLVVTSVCIVSALVLPPIVTSRTAMTPIVSEVSLALT